MFTPGLLVTPADHRDVVLAVIYPACYCCTELPSTTESLWVWCKTEIKLFLGQLNIVRRLTGPEQELGFRFFQKKKKKPRKLKAACDVVSITAS